MYRRKCKQFYILDVTPTIDVAFFHKYTKRAIASDSNYSKWYQLAASASNVRIKLSAHNYMLEDNYKSTVMGINDFNDDSDQTIVLEKVDKTSTCTFYLSTLPKKQIIISSKKKESGTNIVMNSVERTFKLYSHESK